MAVLSARADADAVFINALRECLGLKPLRKPRIKRTLRVYPDLWSKTPPDGRIPRRKTAP